MKKTLLIFVLLIVAALPAKANVFVSKRQGIYLAPISDVIKAGQIKWYPLSTQNGSEYTQEDFTINVSVNAPFPDISAYVCDQNNLNLLVSGNAFRCSGVTKGNGNFKFEAERQAPGKLYLVFDNRYALLTDKQVSAFPYVLMEVSDEQQKAMQDVLSKLIVQLHEGFIFSDFDITLAPCKMENAFSHNDGGHITICTELFYNMMIEDNKGAFMGVLLHELGHTLLNLWDLPNFDNERTADEFAVAMMLMAEKSEGESSVWDWVKWFKEHQNLVGEFQAAQMGDMHPLTTQRINAIEAIMMNPGPVIRRWNNVIYPHMTDDELKKIVSGVENYNGADSELAQKILDQRKVK